MSNSSVDYREIIHRFIHQRLRNKTNENDDNVTGDRLLRIEFTEQIVSTEGWDKLFMIWLRAGLGDIDVSVASKDHIVLTLRVPNLRTYWAVRRYLDERFLQYCRLIKYHRMRSV